MSALTLEVRGRLADAALKAGRPVDAEFLRPDGAATAAKWSDAQPAVLVTRAAQRIGGVQ